MKRIGIRADGNSQTGMGHIMRCLVIAKEFMRRDIEVIFLVKYDEKLIEILRKNKVKYEIIKSQNLKDESKEVCHFIKSLKLDCLLIDSYWISNEYLEEIYYNTNLLVSIDDNNLYHYPSHIILNANIYAKDLKYKLINPKTKLLLGCDYAILREEFIKEPPIIIKDRVENVLVTMGGCDINNYTPTVLKSISKVDTQINVIVGPQFKNMQTIKNLSLINPNINLINNPKSVKDIMKKNDVAISAAGTTTYELGVLGIPTILICQADNQENIGRKTKELEMMISLGNFNQVEEQQIYDNLLYLINNKSKREDMSKKCIQNVGRKGVINIVDEILNYKL